MAYEGEKIVKKSADLDEIINFNANVRHKWIKEKASKTPCETRVLDIGAGECPYRNLFSHCDYKTHDFCQYPGTPNGIQTEAWQYGKIDYVSDITAIPVRNQSFDVVLCTEVLEHVPNPIGAIQEIARILCSGGRLYLTAPLGSGLHQEPFHFYGGFTPHFYNKFLPDFGLKIVEIKPIGGLLKHVGQELHRVGRLFTAKHHRGFNFWHRFFFMNWLPRYLYKLEKDVLVEEFTVGYLIEAQKVT